jgi:hypothetical protein
MCLSCDQPEAHIMEMPTRFERAVDAVVLAVTTIIVCGATFAAFVRGILMMQ